MNQTLLHKARIALQRGIEAGAVLVRNDRIAQVFSDEQTPVGLGAQESIDLGGALLASGLVDIHIHGSAGVDVLDADREGLARLSEFLLAEGVTGYFATLVPTDERGYADAIAEITSYVQSQDEPGRGRPAARARILGLHFEGPFVSQKRCGALRREHFRTYDGDPRSIRLFAPDDQSQPQARVARLMTLAPEIAGGIDLVRELAQSRVRAFIGHTEADLETLDTAARAGARHITHFPNALDPLHHRRPGAVGWGLVRSDITMDSIADFHHVHPLMLELIYNAKGAKRMALISDAILPAGLGDGEYSVWGEKIRVQGGRTALTHGPAEGTIAGSVITLRQALLNMVSLGVPSADAISLASLAPARAAKVEGDCGSIEEGKRADLVAFDEGFNVRLAMVGGRVALDRR